MNAAAGRKVFTIERRKPQNGRPGGLLGPPANQDGPAGLSEDAAKAIAEIQESLKALDVKVNALPKLEEIEDRLVRDVFDMQDRIKTTKEEIAALRHPNSPNDEFARASRQMDLIVEQTEDATSSILAMAETLEDLIGQVRDANSDDQFIANCTDKMSDAITSIYEASNFQDITGQRTRKVVEVIKYIEERLNRMADVWGTGELEAMPVTLDDGSMDDDVALSGPSTGAEGISQDDIDQLFD